MARVYTKEEKRCSGCGSGFIVRLYPDGRYIGGNYFFKIEGKRKREYWECNDCHARNDREAWLEKMIEELYGTRCPDKDGYCPCCQAWQLYDYIVEEGKEQTKKRKEKAIRKRRRK